MDIAGVNLDIMANNIVELISFPQSDLVDEFCLGVFFLSNLWIVYLLATVPGADVKLGFERPTLDVSQLCEVVSIGGRLIVVVAPEVTAGLRFLLRCKVVVRFSSEVLRQ